MSVDRGSLFSIVAIAEAVSWAGLLTGMAFKYVLSDNEIGVKIFGPVHGSVFVLYVLTVFVVYRPLNWSKGVSFVALIASIPPFGSLVFELWAQRRGLLVDTRRPVPVS
jgi:integral membrane protein